MKLKTIEIRGVPVDIHVLDDGRFQASIDDEPLTSDSLENLRQQLLKRTAQKATKVAVPIMRLVGHNGDYSVRTGTATGIHAKNRNVMLRWELPSGKTTSEQIGGWGAKDMLKPLTEAQQQKLIALAKADYQATKALKEFMDEHKIKNLYTVVEKAVADAIEKGEKKS